jgi:hypothetical protein
MHNKHSIRCLEREERVKDGHHSAILLSLVILGSRSLPACLFESSLRGEERALAEIP